MNRTNSKTQKTGQMERLWTTILLVLDLASMEKRISARAAATKKVGQTILIAAGAAVGLLGIVLAAKLKRKIWPNSSRTILNRRETD